MSEKVYTICDECHKALCKCQTAAVRRIVLGRPTGSYLHHRCRDNRWEKLQRRELDINLYGCSQCDLLFKPADFWLDLEAAQLNTPGCMCHTDHKCPIIH